MWACIQVGLWPTGSCSGKIFRQGSEICTLCDRSLSFAHYLCDACVILCYWLFVPETIFLETSCLAYLLSGDISWCTEKFYASLIYLSQKQSQRWTFDYLGLFLCFVLFHDVVLLPSFMDISAFDYCDVIRLEMFEVSATGSFFSADWEGLDQTWGS